MTSIFVAKLDFSVDNQQLSSLFEKYGRVSKATVALDRETKKPRGFGFVEMFNEDEAMEAIKKLDGHVINGRAIAVKKAEDRSNATNKPNRTNDKGNNRSGASSKPSYTPSSPRVESTPDTALPFVPEISKDSSRKKVSKEKRREVNSEGPKSKKMQAYRKSGKDNRFLNDDDFDLDEEDFDLFGRNEDEDLDEEDYSQYLANANDDDDDDFEDSDDFDEE